MKDLDWANLSFGYMKTDYNVRCYYRDGKWGEIEVCSDEYLRLHMAATCTQVPYHMPERGTMARKHSRV